jgi:hypothetical protein
VDRDPAQPFPNIGVQSRDETCDVIFDLVAWEDPTPLGISTPFHGSSEKIHRQKIAADGSISGFVSSDRFPLAGR